MVYMWGSIYHNKDMDRFGQPVSALHTDCLHATKLFMALHDEVLYLIFNKDRIRSIRQSHGPLLDHVSHVINEWKTQSYFVCRPDPNNLQYYSEQTLREKKMEVLNMAEEQCRFCRPKIEEMKHIFADLDYIRHHMTSYSTTQVTISVDDFVSLSYNRKAELELENLQASSSSMGSLEQCIQYLERKCCERNIVLTPEH